MRKMSALTSQGRMGAMIIGGLPVLVGGFVMLTQPDMKASDAPYGAGLVYARGSPCCSKLAAAFVLSKILLSWTRSR